LSRSFWFLLHQVCGIVGIPPDNQFVAGLADMFAVDDCAGDSPKDF